MVFIHIVLILDSRFSVFRSRIYYQNPDISSVLHKNRLDHILIQSYLYHLSHIKNQLLHDYLIALSLHELFLKEFLYLNCCY